MCETGQESAWCLCVRQVSVVFVCETGQRGVCV